MSIGPDAASRLAHGRPVGHVEHHRIGGKAGVAKLGDARRQPIGRAAMQQHPGAGLGQALEPSPSPGRGRNR